MSLPELERVLSNWIAQATSGIGTLEPGTKPETWIAQRFIAWWQETAENELGSMEAALRALSNELERLGGWGKPELGEALHELTHARDALFTLRGLLGLDGSENA